MKKVVKDRKDIVFFVKLFPLPIHKESYAKSKAIVCEKSMTLLEEAFEKKAVPKPKCETTVIDDNIKLAKKLGVAGTPAIIMPDGRLLVRALDAAALISQIDKK